MLVYRGVDGWIAGFEGHVIHASREASQALEKRRKETGARLKLVCD